MKKITMGLLACALAIGAIIGVVAYKGRGDVEHIGNPAHNAQDVAFAQSMITHHRQAVAMATLAGSRSSSATIKRLARAIERAQAPEITRMTAWLDSWGEPVDAITTHTPAAGGHGMNDHDMGSATAGMMSDADMQQLTALTGEAFDNSFLRQMVAHHQGAVAMATTELRLGQSTQAKELAEAVQTAQTAEITAMENLIRPAR